MRLSGVAGTFDFNDKRIFVEETDVTVVGEFTAIAAGVGAQLTLDVANAHLCVVNDLAALSSAVRWAAVVLGQYVCNSQYMHARGDGCVCIKFKRAIETPRKIFVTPACAERHPLLLQRVQRLVQNAPGPKKWKFVGTDTEVVALARRNRARACETVIWTTAEEATRRRPVRLRLIKHYGTPTCFFNTMKEIVPVRCNIGVL